MCPVVFTSRSEHCDELFCINIMGFCSNVVSFGKLYSDIPNSERTGSLKANFASFFDDEHEMHSEVYHLMHHPGWFRHVNRACKS